METWHIVLALLVVMVVGLIKQILNFRSRIKEHNLVCEFLGRYIDWCNDRAQDHSTYNWLLEKSEIVQAALGHSGRMNYRPACERYYIVDTPIILNFIPTIQSEFQDTTRHRGSISQTNLGFMVRSVEECLRRFIGTDETRISRERRRFYNPLVWFGGGIRWILEIPLILLSESGGLSSRRRTAIVKGRIFSFFSGSVSIAAFVGTVMSIILGWDKCVEIVKDWLK